jgi:hypothetical protein
VPGNDSRVELRIPAPLKDWVSAYARRHNTTVSAIVIRFFTRLMEEEAKKNSDAEQV